MSWWLVSLEFVVGCGLLAFGADRFICASAVIAKKFGIPPLVIGLLIVGFGTSFPELVVSFIAALKHNAGIAIGNAIGSNITNVGLCVGVSALLAPLVVHSGLVKREFPILIFITLVVGAFLWSGDLSRIDGIMLIIILVFYIIWLFSSIAKRKITEDELIVEATHEIPNQMKFGVAVVWWVVGLVLLFISSDILVTAAATIAHWLNISDLVIGLTVVAIGTSLPELAVTVLSTLKGEHDIAIGNVVGSNIFNLLAVLAMPALISPTKVSSGLIYRDYPIMLGFSSLLWLLSFGLVKRGVLGRVAGGVILLAYVAFLAMMVLVSL